MLSPLKKRLGVFTAIAVTAALVPALVASPASAAASAAAAAPLFPVVGVPVGPLGVLLSQLVVVRHSLK